MAKLVDLSKKPYYLDETQIAWVEKTIESMTDEEKVGQLFTNLFFFGGDAFSGNNLSNEEILNKYHIGGVRYMNGAPEDVQGLINELQSKTKIPLLVAANCDSGGDGAVKGGTYISSGAQSEASRDTWVPYHAGLVSAREETALGVNVNFDPCVDILQNWRNTIVNTRSYGTTAEDVIKYTNAYVEGLKSEREVVCCVKHFPGDGTEERDQHLILGVNELSVEEWENSFGKVYRNHIDNGVEMIMAGHIALPEYQKALRPELEDKDILPATLAEELIQDLLKEKLDFNGMVITDASHMLGMSSAMRREDYVPGAIAAGCDMFLFFNNMEEDFNFMMNGYKNGVITEERMTDALRRILGLKAKLHLPEKQENGTLLKSSEELRLYYLDGEKGGIIANDDSVLNRYVDELTARGYEVTVNDGNSRIKGRTLEYREQVDLALVVANVIGYGAQNNYRIQWKTAMSNEVPWYVHEVPTVFVSTNFTTHLHDATMVKTFINAYHGNENSVKAVIDKLEGKSEFKGRANDLVWTDKWQAKL